MDERTYLPPEPVPAPRYPAGKRELAFGAAMLVCSVFLWNFILYGGFNLGFAIGAIAVIGCSVWYLTASGYRFDAYSGALILFSVLIAAGFARSSDGFVKFVMLLFLLFSVNLSFCLVTGQNRRSPNGLGSVLDAPRACFKLGFGSVGAATRGLSDARKNAGSAGKKGSAAVLGLVIAVPVVAVMVLLLMRADAAFEGLVDLLPEMELSEPFNSLIFGGFAAWVLYARGVGLRHAPKPVPKERTFKGISPITVNILLGAAALVYCVYLLSQLAYISGGFSGILPAEYTLAQYARRGFFEMAWLSAINLGLMCCAMGLVEKGEKSPALTKAFCLFLGLVTLFLISTASAKMFLYIGSYGLTRLRVLTEIIMVWLGITTVLVSVWLFKPKFPYMKAVVIAALVLGTVTFWADVDTQVAKYNVRAYQSGKLTTIDMAHLSGLGYGAMPYIEELTRDADPEVAEIANNILTRRHFRVEDFRDWNHVKAGAEKLSGKLEESSLPEDIIIRSSLNLSLEEATLLNSRDTHSGFQGDGETFTVLQFPQSQDAVMEKTAADNILWHSLPLTENLSLALYGGENRASFFTDETGGPLMPEVENGYYFFQDRHSQSVDSSDDSPLFTRASYNFTLAVYDADTDILYYFELDT